MDRLTSRTAQFYLFLYLSQGVIIPFFPLWLTGRGLTKEQVGTLLSLSYLPKLISNPLLAHFSDRSGEIKRLIVAALAAAAALHLLYLIDLRFAGLLAVAVLAAACMSAVFPLWERYAVLASRLRGLRYGRARLWGSLGFGAGTLAVGQLTGHVGSDWILPIILCLLGACLLAVARLPDLRASADRPAPAGAPPFRLLLKNRSLVWVIVACAILQSTNGFLYAFSTIFWIERGLSPALIGVLWATGITFEVGFFLIGHRFLARFGPLNTLLAAAALTAVRWTVLGATSSLPALLAAQVLQAFTIGANNMALMAWIAERADQRCQASAIALYIALAMGVLIFATISLSSLLYARFDIPGFFAMAVLCLASMAITLGVRRDAAGGTVRA
jgi:MFS transporter, PPP family, 3-phenylpropionic acid transporter